MEACVFFQFHSYSNYVQLIKAALCQVAQFVERTFFSLCSHHIGLYEASEIFAVRHSPYPASKFELGRPSEHGENGWNTFWMNEK